MAAKNSTTESTKKETGVAAPAFSRIHSIVLFGSQKLVREDESGSWVFECATAKPKRLTRRESMLVNAALHAAGVQ
jgi:hypothetical protein